MSRPRSRIYRPLVETLDDRCLLAASGLTPAQIATAYGLGGLTSGGQAANGSGQTIAIVDAYNDPNIAAELAMFDSTNNLPAPPSLTVVGETGTQALPRTDVSWAQEEALDVEWAHAIAPGASIVLVETNSFNIPDLMAGVKTAVAQPGVSVVSMSWGGSEISYVTSLDRLFTAAGITFVAASGDDGAFSGAQWPASSSYVVGVGGTTLQVGGNGTYQGETAWAGSSGGDSTIETEPSYQESVQSSGWRSTPDVAFDADPNTGVEVYSIDANSGRGSWLTAGGTSLGAPSWAAIVAIVDQGRAQNNAGALGSFQTLTALYSLPTSDFHVIGGGYNTQTGLGTPNGGSLIKDLVAYDTSSVTSTPPVTTPTPTTPPITTWPVISLPVTTPVSTTPVTTTPVSTTPVSTTPVNTTPVPSVPVSTPVVSSPPVTVQQSLTPPPAAPPVSVKKAVKKKIVSKHAPDHAKVVHHPKPHVSSTAKAKASRCPSSACRVLRDLPLTPGRGPNHDVANDSPGRGEGIGALRGRTRSCFQGCNDPAS